VTSIYLGYRAFDTLGETVVLVAAVSGVLFLVERKR
jgi:multicomponent Na+:H+ antiporter subunit B